jgi:predicted ribosome quality control (RQC) complex YloA/Tae2 family protein
MTKLYPPYQELLEEVYFLRQRNSELRKKSYIQVYDENLKLTEEHKTLVKTIDQLRKELIQISERAERYRVEGDNLQKENYQLKGVLKSVEAFIEQFTE